MLVLALQFSRSGVSGTAERSTHTLCGAFVSDAGEGAGREAGSLKTEEKTRSPCHSQGGGPKP
jgi:hypothetical protein